MAAFLPNVCYALRTVRRSALPNSVLVVVALMVILVARPSGQVPVRIGEVVTDLSEPELAQVMRLSACGAATPWLLIGYLGQVADMQLVEVFCDADQVSNTVRRGTLAWVIRRVAREGGWGPWALDSTHRYAQVADAARRFTAISGTGDPNRPIRIQGTVADADLVQILEFLRDSPSKVGGNERDRVEGEWPVIRVTLQPDATILVVLSKVRFESQRVVLRRTASGWEVLSVNYVVA